MAKTARGRPGKARKKAPPSSIVDATNNTGPPPDPPTLPPPKLSTDPWVRDFFKKAYWKPSFPARPGNDVASGPIVIADTRASQCDYSSQDKSVPYEFLKDLKSHDCTLPYRAEYQLLLENSDGEAKNGGRVPRPPPSHLLKFYKFLDSCEPHPTKELAIMQAKGGMSHAQRELRDDTLKDLKVRYPFQWQNAIKDMRKSDSSSGTSPAKYGFSNQRELKPRELVPGMPLHLGCMVVDMPITIVYPLIGYYGDPKVQQTVLGGASFSPAVPIASSPKDEKIRAMFVADLVATQAAEAAEAAGTAAEGSAAPDLAVAAEVFKQVVLEASLTVPALVKAAVEHDVQGTGLRSTKVNGRPVMARVDDDAEGETYKVVEAVLKTMQDRLNRRKEEWTLKSFQEKWVEELHHLFLDTPFSKEVKVAYNYLLKSWNIEAWFFRQAHTRYFFHHWYVLHNVRNPKVGVEFECHELLKTCRSPYDCPTLTDSAADALSQLEYLAKDVLENIMSQKPPPPTQYGKKSQGNSSTPKHVSSPPPASTNDLKSLLSSIVMFPGVLKTGNQNMHQRLHVDFGGVLGSDLLRKVCTQDYAHIGINEWLAYGYYIDMPLSAEGSWLRVAVPDPAKKRFVIELVFIPFGSFVIRSAALFHSGHYGSPGNTRIHALMMLEGKQSDTRNIGHLNVEITDQESPIYNWAIDWSEQAIQYNAHVDAKYVMYHYPRHLHKGGIGYLRRIMANPSGRLLTHLWMLNPSKGLPPALPPRKYALSVNKKKNQNSHSAVASNKRKKPPQHDEEEGQLPCYVDQQPDYAVLGPIVFGHDDEDDDDDEDGEDDMV